MTQHHAKAQPSVALFGGSFDPIHSGHLAVARSAVKKFGLDRVYFIPSGVPPHKPTRHLAPYAHRVAMASLACADHPEFVPSLAEAGEDQGGHQIFYSVDTVRHFRHTLHAHEHIYFIMGADQFLGIATWKDYETLLGMCDFIVANRPGFRIEALRLRDSAGIARAPRSAGRACGRRCHRAPAHGDSSAYNCFEPRLIDGDPSAYT